MAGRDVKTRAGRKIGQCGLAAGLRDCFEQKQRAVDGLDAVAFAFSASAWRPCFCTRPGQDRCVHWCFLPMAKRRQAWRESQGTFSMANAIFLLRKYNREAHLPGLSKFYV
jgi:hypothetical protein